MQVTNLTLTVPAASGPVNILRGVDMAVRSGEAVGIVGPSGSGKTSLLMVLAGLERATSGSVRIGGREITGLDEDALARLRRQEIGIVFQAFHLIASMTALENVAIPLELAGGRARHGPGPRQPCRRSGWATGSDHLPRPIIGGRATARRPRACLRPRHRACCSPMSRPEIWTAPLARWVMDLLFRSAGPPRDHAAADHPRPPPSAARCARVVRIGDGRVVEAAGPAGAA